MGWRTMGPRRIKGRRGWFLSRRNRRVRVADDAATKDEAFAAWRAMENDGRLGDPRPAEEDCPITVGELFEAYFAEKTAGKPRMEKRIRCESRPFLAAVGADRRAATVTAEDVRAWAASMAGRWSPTTLRMAVATMATVFAYAGQEAADPPLAGVSGEAGVRRHKRGGPAGTCPKRWDDDPR